MEKMKKQAKRAGSRLALLLPEMEKMKKPAKRDWSRLALLPEPMIHMIQSRLTGKEAAQSSFLSKSWYDAWLTRPTPSFDEGDFKKGLGFAERSKQVMDRYRDMNLRIESFTFRTENSCSLAMKLTADAIKIGATDLNIEVPPAYYFSNFVLPAEVLESETLARLYLRGGKIASGKVRCSRLKSLILRNVDVKYVKLIEEIISCCSTSIEELSLFIGDNINVKHLFELHKLRRLHLRFIDLEQSFFGDLESKFPLLKDLSVYDYCVTGDLGCRRIQIASTSLECISFVQHDKALEVKLDVPNLRKFVYKGGLPSLSFKACSRYPLECYISINWNLDYNTSAWFMALENLLSKLRRASSPSSPSRISLSIFPCLDVYDYWSISLLEERETEVVVAEPVVVENLTIYEEFYTPAFYTHHLQLGLFRVCRPCTVIVHAYDHLS